MYQSDFLSQLKDKYDVSRKERDIRITAERVKRDHAGEINKRLEKTIEERLKEHLQITEVAVVEVGKIAQNRCVCHFLWDTKLVVLKLIWRFMCESLQNFGN